MRRGGLRRRVDADDPARSGLGREPGDHARLGRAGDGAHDDGVEEDAQLALLALDLHRPGREAQATESVVRCARRDGVRRAARRLDLRERLLPALLEADAEARLDQPDIGAHDPGQLDVAHPVIHRIGPVHPALLDQHAPRPRCAAVAATWRVWLDWTPPMDTSVSAPCASASAARYSSLRTLLPPNARPELTSSRLAHTRAPPRWLVRRSSRWMGDGPKVRGTRGKVSTIMPRSVRRSGRRGDMVRPRWPGRTTGARRSDPWERVRWWASVALAHRDGPALREAGPDGGRLDPVAHGLDRGVCLGGRERRRDVRRQDHVVPDGPRVLLGLDDLALLGEHVLQQQLGSVGMCAIRVQQGHVRRAGRAIAGDDHLDGRHTRELIAHRQPDVVPHDAHADLALLEVGLGRCHRREVACVVELLEEVDARLDVGLVAAMREGCREHRELALCRRDGVADGHLAGERGVLEVLPGLGNEAARRVGVDRERDGALVPAGPAAVGVLGVVGDEVPHGRLVAARRRPSRSRWARTGCRCPRCPPPGCSSRRPSC